MKLTEVLTDGYHWKWTAKSKEHRAASFISADNTVTTILFTASQTPAFIPTWIVDFYKIDSTTGEWDASITNTGDAFKIFATVINCILAFVSEFDPESLSLSAKEPSRKKLYTRMIKQHFPDWFVQRTGDDFILYNPKWM